MGKKLHGLIWYLKSMGIMAYRVIILAHYIHNDWQRAVVRGAAGSLLRHHVLQLYWGQDDIA
jgi:hypothetical protein